MAREIYEDYTDQIEPFGLDENWLDVTGSTGLFGNPMHIAQEIRERIRFELGITASIGISNNKITAKLGSDYKKPDAITRIERDNYKEIVYPLPVEALLYVGPATSRKLRRSGIGTIGQLAESRRLLTGKLGKTGAMLHRFANGWDASPCGAPTYPRRAIGRQQRDQPAQSGNQRGRPSDAAPAQRKRVRPHARTGVQMHGGGTLGA